MDKICICGYEYLDRVGIDAGFGMLSTVGFDAVDFPLYKSKGIEVRSTDLSYYDGIKKLADKHGLIVGQTHAPYGYREDILARHDELIGIYRNAIEATASLGCDKVVIHPVKFDDCVNDYRREECFDLNIGIYSELKPMLKDYGVTVLLENMFITVVGNDGYKRLYPTIYSSAEELARAADKLGENFGVCFDFGHANITGEDIPSAIHLLGDRLKAVHVHDNCGARDAHSIPFNGKANIMGGINALKEIGYNGILDFEVHLKHTPTEVLEDTLGYIAKIGKMMVLPK